MSRSRLALALPPEQESRGGKAGAVVLLHQICHNEIHATLPESDLARAYHTIETLREHPRLAAFIRWVARRPPDFLRGHRAGGGLGADRDQGGPR